jgi:hypothetical protein
MPNSYEGPFKPKDPIGMEHFLPEEGKPAFPIKDHTGEIAGKKETEDEILARLRQDRIEAIRRNDKESARSLGIAIQNLLDKMHK